MAEPVNHGIVSGAATGAWETVKGTVKGALALPVGGALVGAVVGAIGLGVIALSGGAVVGVAASMYAAVTGASISSVGTIAAVSGLAGALVGGVGGAVTGGSAGTAAGILAWPITAVTTVVGAVTGIFKGAHRVSEESQAYQQKLENRALAGMSKVQYAQAVGQQQGYVAGLQQGEQMGAEKVMRAFHSSIAERMGPAAQKNHAAAIEAERAAAAATTGKQR